MELPIVHVDAFADAPFTGDGVPDVVVGDQSTANDTGAVDVLSGAAIVAAAGRLPVPW